MFCNRYFVILLSIWFITSNAGDTMKSLNREGLECFNCLSHDHEGCWDPNHPSVANISVPKINCYMKGIEFTCVTILAESAKLVDSGDEIGGVIARTCIPSRNFPKTKTVPYALCEKVAKELANAEVFTAVQVTKPKCLLCRKPLCTEP